MTGLVIGVLMIVAVGIGGLMWISSRRDTNTALPEPAPTKAELLQARLDLHRIERGVDLTLAREEAHRRGQQTKDSITEALENRQ